MKLFFNDIGLLKVGKAHREEFEAAEPFPSVVLDDVLNPEALEIVLRDFPSPTSKVWLEYENYHERKLETQGESKLSDDTCLVLYQFNSPPFLRFLERLTGIPDLIPDPYFKGGGLHQIVTGGKLGIHADFHRHEQLGLERRLNVLIYLNKEWKSSYGGELELWDSDVTRCVRRIEPLFNRMVVFRITDRAFHGHPEPLQCPPDMTRKSIALYYYTVGRPADEYADDAESTVFRRRPGEVVPEGTIDERTSAYTGVKPPTPERRARRVLKRITPPIIVDLARRVAGQNTKR